MRRDVDEHRSDFEAGDQPRLHGRSHGDAEVRVHLAVSGLAELLLEEVSDERRPRRAADEDDAIDLGRLQLGVGEGPAQAFQRPRQGRADHLLEFAAGSARD